MEDEFKEDLRVVRTRALLSKALFELLEKTPFEKISVKDICDKALVHRATFYNHFEDKEDLLEYTIDEIKEEMFNSVVEKEQYETPKEMYMTLMSKVLDFVEQHKNQLMLIINNNSTEKVMGLLLTTVKRSMRYLLSKNKYKSDLAIPVNIIIDFISGGITNLGLCWFQSNDSCTKQELLNYIDKMLDEKVFVNKN